MKSIPAPPADRQGIPAPPDDGSGQNMTDHTNKVCFRTAKSVFHHFYLSKLSALSQIAKTAPQNPKSNHAHSSGFFQRGRKTRIKPHFFRQGLRCCSLLTSKSNPLFDQPKQENPESNQPQSVFYPRLQLTYRGMLKPSLQYSVVKKDTALSRQT